MIAKLWDGGFLDDVSVSFRVNAKTLTGPVQHEGRDYMVSTSHELLECSVVGIGADPNAGKGRLAEAVARGVITDNDARSLDPGEREPHGNVTDQTEEITRLTTEAATLREELETLRQEVGRLREEAAARIPPVLKIADSEPQRKDPRITVSPEAIRQAITERIGATIKATIEARLRRERGMLPD